MTTHLPNRSAATLLLDAEAIDRTLSRIARRALQESDTRRNLGRAMHWGPDWS